MPDAKNALNEIYQTDEFSVCTPRAGERAMSATLVVANEYRVRHAESHAFCAPCDRLLSPGTHRPASDHSRRLCGQPALAGAGTGRDRAARERRGVAALCQCR